MKFPSVVGGNNHVVFPWLKSTGKSLGGWGGGERTPEGGKGGKETIPETIKLGGGGGHLVGWRRQQ